MKVVIQRVHEGSVTVAGNVVGQIGKGLVVLLGIERNDTAKDAALIIRKTLSARLWEDAKGKDWGASVVDKDYSLLVISQFTLYGSVRKKPAPDFHVAMKNSDAKSFFEEILEMFRAEYRPDRIATGEFGAHMDVSLTNDGPVTIMIDSRDWNIDDVPELASTTKAKVAAMNKKAQQQPAVKAEGEVAADSATPEVKTEAPTSAPAEPTSA